MILAENKYNALCLQCYGVCSFECGAAFCAPWYRGYRTIKICIAEKNPQNEIHNARYTVQYSILEKCVPQLLDLCFRLVVIIMRLSNQTGLVRQLGRLFSPTCVGYLHQAPRHR